MQGEILTHEEEQSFLKELCEKMEDYLNKHDNVKVEVEELEP